MRKGYKLPDEHLVQAKDMVLRYRRKKKCNHCYDRGFLGYSEENLLVICHRCVDQDKVLEEWNAYVRAVPELWAEFREDVEKEEAEKKKSLAEQAKAAPAAS
jgi:hypothetical protein